jgi:hypothetical protein
VAWVIGQEGAIHERQGVDVRREVMPRTHAAARNARAAPRPGKGPNR